MDEMIITQGGLETVPQLEVAAKTLADMNTADSGTSDKVPDTTVASITETEVGFEQTSGWWDDFKEDLEDVIIPDTKGKSWKEFLSDLGDTFKNLKDLIKAYRELNEFVEGEAVEYLTQFIPGFGGADDVINILTNADELETFLSGDFQWKVSFDEVDWDNVNLEDVEWSRLEDTLSTIRDIIRPEGNGMPDVFFCSSENKFWGEDYAAQHLGVKGVWEGTGEIVSLAGKNLFTRIIYGSTDLNAMLLNDNSSGDALFLDDIFHENGNNCRLASLDEIQAGNGDDIIDLTSQRYVYVFKDNLTIRGGNGDDVIWASCGKTTIFGDKGDDRIIGGINDDVIIGGAGNDTMHGGGGNDTFCFGGNWGNDTVEQLASGSVTLWFEYGSESNWNAETRTYSDGINTVTVNADQVTLKFGNTSAAVENAFADFSSEKVYGKDNILNMIVG